MDEKQLEEYWAAKIEASKKRKAKLLAKDAPLDGWLRREMRTGKIGSYQQQALSMLKAAADEAGANEEDAKALAVYAMARFRIGNFQEGYAVNRFYKAIEEIQFKCANKKDIAILVDEAVSRDVKYLDEDGLRYQHEVWKRAYTKLFTHNYNPIAKWFDQPLFDFGTTGDESRWEAIVSCMKGYLERGIFRKYADLTLLAWERWTAKISLKQRDLKAWFPNALYTECIYEG